MNKHYCYCSINNLKFHVVSTTHRSCIEDDDQTLLAIELISSTPKNQRVQIIEVDEIEDLLYKFRLDTE